MITNLPLLSVLIWLPIIGGLVILLSGGEQKANQARIIALIISIITFILSIGMAIFFFDTSTAAFQLIEYHAWIPWLNINYYLGVDGIAVPLIILTTFISVLVILMSWQSVHKKVAQYLAAFLIMQGFMSGVFSALDAVLFYIFWEAMLIPMFIIIGVWGSTNRVYAAIKFFLYTFLGSVLMLAALLYLYVQTGSFNIVDFYSQPLSFMPQVLIFLAFFAAFAVKIPMWPVHTWLPDAHTEAPAGGSVVLAAIMLKMGAYGFFRFALPIAPDAAQELAWLMVGLSIIGVVYIGFVALAQKDMKRLIAYSSIAHMGFVTLGMFIIFMMANTHSDYAQLAMEGALFQMISHGFISGALFFAIGVLYDRLHSRNIDDFGGVVNKMPFFAALVMLFAMANAGLPGTSGFVGEFMVILATFKANPSIALLSATTLILGAAYTLWMYKRVFFGEVVSQKVEALTEITLLEKSVLVMLAILVLIFGIYPNLLLEFFHAPVEQLLEYGLTSKLI